MATISYPLDITGLASSNLITDELQTITEVNSNTYRIIIPKFVPFYLNNLVVKYVDIHSVETILEEKKDYFICLPFVGGTRALGKLIYGAISLNNKYIAGTIKVTYQALGGPWAVDKDAIVKHFMETQSNPKTIAWDLILDKPSLFAPSNHQHHVKDIYGHRDLIDAINGLKTVITSTPTVSPALTTHMADTTNPHQVTAAQIGLDKVVNLPMATDAEVLAQAPLDKYVTMKQFIDLLNALTPPPPSNNLPIGTVLISGNQPVGSVLTCTNTLSDADGLGTFSYQWYSGTTKVGTNATTYTSVVSDIGNVIVCTISYTDKKGNNESVTSNSITVTAAAPVGIVSIVGSPYVGQVLSGSNTLTNIVQSGVVYTWYDYDPTSITGGGSFATGSTYLVKAGDTGKQLWIRATYTDTSGHPGTTDSLPVTVTAAANNLPTGGFTVIGTTAAGSILTLDTANLADADILGTFSYQWKANYTDISGATTATYTTLTGDIGKIISCTISYTDGAGNPEKVDSTNSITVTSGVNNLPTGTVTINGNTDAGSVLSLTNTIADVDGLGSFHYQWYSATSKVGTDSNTYTTNMSDVGLAISCVVSYTDGLGNAESVTSNSITVTSPAVSSTASFITAPLTGEYYTYTVPAGIHKIDAILAGAGGGGGGWDSRPHTGGDGGDGDKITVKSIPVTPGEILRVYVGVGGAGGVTGYNTNEGKHRFPPESVARKLPSIVNLDTLLAAPLVSGVPIVKYTHMAASRGEFLQKQSFWYTDVATPANGVTKTWEWDFTFPRDNTYVITTASDDYSDLYIDGTMSNSSGTSNVNISTYVSIKAGTHRIKVVGKNIGGGAACVAVDISETSGGFSRGGIGGQNAASNVGNGGSGGGASAIVRDSTGEVLAVAAGGGGGGGGDWNRDGYDATTNTIGYYTANPAGDDTNRGNGGGGGGGYDLQNGVNVGNGKGGTASTSTMLGGYGGNIGKSYVASGLVFTNTAAGNKGIASTSTVTGDGGMGMVTIVTMV